MAPTDLKNWLDKHSNPDSVWYAKRLSGNDTLANRTHQAGPYIPKDFLFGVFPKLNRPKTPNPDVRFNLYIDSHADHRCVRAIWYNNKFHNGTRNETRLTKFGGSQSALLDPSNTGALSVFAFSLDDQGTATECYVWVCRCETEEELVEERIGPVEPGKRAIWSPDHAAYLNLFKSIEKTRANCWLDPSEIPPEWLKTFPTGMELIDKAVELRPYPSLSPDRRLLRRRDCEFELFRSVEEAVELPVIGQGFDNMDEFIARAQTILQRRKSRSGRSLELHVRKIFIEEGLRKNQDFAHQQEAEPSHRPDFLFPSADAYKDMAFPEERLRMLAVKTTCKDRWRQILNEANRIKRKHLLTLQEGVSEGQFREMKDAGVQLVIPTPLVNKFPALVRPHLNTLEDFIADVRGLKLDDSSGSHGPSVYWKR